MSVTLTFRDGSKLEVLEAPHDDGADRLIDAHTQEETIMRSSAPGWVAVTSLEPDADGHLEHVARWIDAAEIVEA